MCYVIHAITIKLLSITIKIKLEGLKRYSYGMQSQAVYIITIDSQFLSVHFVDKFILFFYRMGYVISKWMSSRHLVKVTRITITMVTGLTILLILPVIFSQQIQFVNGQQQQQQQYQQNVSGSGQGILPGDVPTLFSFKFAEHKDGKVSGNFECFALMPDGSTMYVNGTVTDLAVNQTSVVLSGPTIVTGFGAGSGTFEAIASMPEGRVVGAADSADNGTLILTTDVNGDNVQASANDGSEGPFNEKIIKGSIQLGP